MPGERLPRITSAVGLWRGGRNIGQHQSSTARPLELILWHNPLLGSLTGNGRGGVLHGALDVPLASCESEEIAVARKVEQGISFGRLDILPLTSLYFLERRPTGSRPRASSTAATVADRTRTATTTRSNLLPPASEEGRISAAQRVCRERAVGLNEKAMVWFSGTEELFHAP